MKRFLLLLLMSLLSVLVLIGCDDSKPDESEGVDTESSEAVDTSENVDSGYNTDTSDKSEESVDSSENVDESIASSDSVADSDVEESVDTSDSTSSLAYNFKMQNLNGEELQLSDLTGKPIVLNFWASWCPPCKAEMPDFQSAYNKYKDTVTFVMVSVDDTLEDAKDFYEGSGYTFPAYFDSLGEGSYLYGISSIPQSFFIGAVGKIISSHTGMISAAQLENGINELIK